MQKHIVLDYGFDTPWRQRIENIRRAGFDGVMLLFESRPDFYDAAEGVCKSGLSVESLHLPFRAVANNIWRGEEAAEQALSVLRRGIRFASQMKIPYATLHLSSTFFPPPKNGTGLKRLVLLTDYAERLGVTLCIENLKRTDYFRFGVDHLDERVKICFDAGHAQIYCKRMRSFPLERYAARIVCCHLHDNNRLVDQHRLLFDGTIDANFLARTLSQCPALRTLTLESFCKNPKRHDESTYLSRGYSALVRLESLIGESTHES